ncbi:MAG: hypothetical protein WEB53_06280 [Akkermansiaceae bacterium]
MTAEKALPNSSKSAFTKLLSTGLIGWALGVLILLGLAWPIAKPESFAIAVIWAISHWWAAFALGAVLLIARGLISRLAIGSAMLAYLLPATILLAVAGICQLVYPDRGFREDLFSYLPLVLIFYIIGLIWSSLSKDETDQAGFIRAVLPAALGGLIILGFVAVPVFSSNAFIYHEAFDLKVTDRKLQNGSIAANAVLEIRKPGNYNFTAPRYIYSAFEEMGATDSTIEYGQITWGTAGEPKPNATGSYPFQVRWLKNVPTTEKELADRLEYEDPITMEVRDPSKETEQPIYNIYAPLPSAVE